MTAIAQAQDAIVMWVRLAQRENLGCHIFSDTHTVRALQRTAVLQKGRCATSFSVPYSHSGSAWEYSEYHYRAY